MSLRPQSKTDPDEPEPWATRWTSPPPAYTQTDASLSYMVSQPPDVGPSPRLKHTQRLWSQGKFQKAIRDERVKVSAIMGPKAIMLSFVQGWGISIP